MRYLLILCVIFSYSCKNNSNTTSSTVNQTAIVQEPASNKFEDLLKNLPTYSEDFSAEKLAAFIVDDDEGFYVNKSLVKTNAEAQLVLNETKTEHDTDNWLYNVSNREYYPLYKIIKSDAILIGSFVEYAGENDIPGVFFQWNSFDKKGTQQDYLIVLNRFSFELVLKSEFEVNNDFSEITVSSVEEDWIAFDEQGDIIGEREKPLTTKTSKTYFLSKVGTFSED